jgi:integrase
VRYFLCYLGADYPEINRLGQLRRDPHILGWMSRMRSQKPPLATVTCSGRLIALRGVFNELAWSNKHSELARLIRREDIPRKPHRLPRPLTAEQDQLLQQEFLRRNDLGGNAFLLIRHTGMRIGECVDLSCDCLSSTGHNQWAIHVPLGKLKTERMVPVDASTGELVQRLRFFRSLDPLPADGRLLARTSSKHALVRRLRDYLHEVCYSLNLSIRIVPHPNIAQGSTASSNPCAPLNMCWRCSAVHCQMALLALASTGSPTVSPRSSQKYANSPHHENGQRLAG